MATVPLENERDSVSGAPEHTSQPFSAIADDTFPLDTKISEYKEADTSRGVGEVEESPFSNTTQIEVHPPPLSIPKSAYAGHISPLPASKERNAVDDLLEAESVYYTEDDDDYPDFSDVIVLDDFVIYRDDTDNPKQHGYITFTSLNDVATKQGASTFFFDGVLRRWDRGGRSYYLERCSFSLVSISGYENVERHTVGEDFWIQSTHCRWRGEGDVWYRLGKPAKEYEQYQKLFIWVANLSKHLVDYFHNHEDVKLDNFRNHFMDWLLSHHSHDPDFMEWFSEYGKRDFRQAIVAHSLFLHKHALDLDPAYVVHPLWSEIDRPSTTSIIKQQPMKAKDTIVTPYVYRCFGNMVWSGHLKMIDLSARNLLLHQQRLKEMGFIGGRGKKPAVRPKYTGDPLTSFKIAPGDVIATRKDEVSSWKSEDAFWYALVQDVLHARRNARLHVIWLYRPTDTVCADLTYPHRNELFLSDHCNCDDAPFNITEVVKKVPVTFSANQAVGGAEFFVRQTYNSSDETFTTLKDRDFLCSCRQIHFDSPNPGYEVGDTVLAETATISNELRLEPVQIVKFDQYGDVQIRELPRRGHAFNDPSRRPNELVYTDRFRTIQAEQIQRPCHIRFYTEEEKVNGTIPAPYSRDGNGDAFYIVVREAENGGLEAFKVPNDFNEGFNPRDQTSRLRALNIFSGGGNFDRGLEEGSAIRGEWAVEWGLHQMLTYRANHEEPEQLKLFCGSVNDYLTKAARGSSDNLVARIGEVQFLSAGSPCQGYSLVNSKKENEGSMRNSSMIASVAAFIDFYRPKYAILENVTAMASKQVKQNPFSQLLCAFVGMGYQLRILNLDAWSFGAPQSRSRLFVIIAAPGLELPAHPPLTHSHPKGTTQRSLGAAPNGLPFGRRQWDVPVFDFVTAAEGTKDLPSIGSAKLMSISKPDHRPPRIESSYNQNIINSIPKNPRTMGLQNALQRGWVSANHADSTARLLKGQRVCRSWSRVHPNTLLGTVTTSMGPSCRFTGRWLHWDEDRLITVQEARRAQGFPDSEVIIGRPSQQYKIIGNSVARQVALALGLAVRDACLKNEKPHESGQAGLSEAAVDSLSECPVNRVDELDPGGPDQLQISDKTIPASPASSTTITPHFDVESQDRPDSTNTSVSPDPYGHPSEAPRKKRGFQVFDKVVIPVLGTPPAKRLKENSYPSE